MTYYGQQGGGKNGYLARDKGQRVYGICLMTDAERYTALCERLEPERLHALMNRYYEALFEPVIRRGGIISNIVGDSMLALWTTELPDRRSREQACLAALEIADAAERFNLAQDGIRLPTRIGLHCGELVLGPVGAADHYEYRAVGDIVNTASRVQGLNKGLPGLPRGPGGGRRHSQPGTGQLSINR
jgi:adenylate cyclase